MAVNSEHKCPLEYNPNYQNISVKAMQALKSLSMALPPCFAFFRSGWTVSSMNRSFSVFNPISFLATPNSTLLKPNSVAVQQCCGLKVKGVPKLRCKDCYKVWRDERLYIMCKSYGRHKQTQMKKKPKTTWKLTHATQSKIRPW